MLAVTLACGPAVPAATSDATTPASSTGDVQPTSAATLEPTSTGSASNDSTTATDAGTTTGASSDSTTASTGTTNGAGSDSTTASTGTTNGASSDSTTASPGTTTFDTGSEDSGDQPVGEPAACPMTVIEQSCPPVNCDNVSCGGLFDDVDELGKKRKACAAGTCACDPGFTCFHSSEWGGCKPSFQKCAFHTEDCGAAYCVPDGIDPPPFACSGTDQATCEAAGCTFAMTPFVSGDRTCQCGPPLPSCLWFPKPTESVPVVTAYYHAFVPGDVRLFPASWSEPPWPWKPCAGDPDAPPDCNCADDCMP